MKRAIAVLLAILMIFSLFACNGKTTTDTSASPSEETQDAAPATSEATTEEEATSEETAAETVDPSVNADAVGFFASGVDPQSRETYQITWAYVYTLMLFEKMTECFKNYEDTLNVEINTMTTESDIDLYLINIETLAAQGTDGFLIHLDVATSDRIIEVLDETGVPYVSIFNSYRDDDGNSLIPTIGLDQYDAGAITMEWLCENYASYWGDIDTSKLGLINFTLSTSVDLNDRANGAQDVFLTNFPENSELVFEGDGASGSGSSQDIAYNIAAATYAANPDVEYWFVASCLEMYAQGAVRAAEQLGIEDHVLIVDVGSDILCAEWDTGYEGAWASCLAISNYLYAAPGICGLVSLLDGVSTPESLWPDMKEDGDVGAFYAASSQMITNDTYKDYFNGVAEEAGMPLAYTE